MPDMSFAALLSAAAANADVWHHFELLVLQREGSLATGASFYRGVLRCGLAYTDILVDTKRSGFARGTTIQWSNSKATYDRFGPVTNS